MSTFERLIAAGAGCLAGVFITSFAFIFSSKSDFATGPSHAVITEPFTGGNAMLPKTPVANSLNGDELQMHNRVGWGSQNQAAAGSAAVQVGSTQLGPVFGGDVPAQPLRFDPGDPKGLIVMVPFSAYIDPKVDEKLRYLQNKGFTVLRRQGAALDNICSAMATQVLREGWQELLWIDASVDFDLGGVGAVRNSGKSIVGALYPGPDGKSFATHFLEDSAAINLGEGGGLLEVEHTGMGFLYMKAEVFSTIKSTLSLPDCNEGFEDQLVPYFKSFVAERNGKPTYLVYHRAFCERARKAGLKVYVDTRIRASTVGPRPILWEDVVSGGPRLPRSRITTDVKALHADFV